MTGIIGTGLLGQALVSRLLGKESSCPLPLSRQHHTLLQQAIDLGLADQNNSAIIEAWREMGEQY